jgi:hypothetical protein
MTDTPAKTEYADNPATEAAKKQYAIEKETADRIRADAAERLGKGRPTPTQEELDMTMLGAQVISHEDDGSGPDLNQRALEAAKGGGYQTRQTTAVPPHRNPAAQARAAATTQPRE